MIARAAAAPPSADNAAAACGMPARNRSILRLTPITPVDATSVSCVVHPTACAANCAISRASAMPCGPVHALAQPLLVMMARTCPWLAARCSWHSSTGAAFAMLTVKIPAAWAGRSLTIRARSGLPLALIPQCSPEARNPAGAVTPPSIDRRLLTMVHHADGGSHGRSHGGSRAGSHGGSRVLEIQHDCVLAALAEERAGRAVVRDLLGHPGVGHD